MRDNDSDGGSPTQPRTLVVIGNFDGVHRGHQQVLGAAAGRARSLGLQPIVLTFSPHPSEVLGRGALPVLTTLERRAELIQRLDPLLRVEVRAFDRELASYSPRRFAAELLVAELGARAVQVGENFRFGHERAGDLNALRALGDELGFDAYTEPLVGDEHGAFSSTRIRQSIAEGDLVRARALLGRPHCLSGRVVRGDQRGRRLGAPTANLANVPEAKPAFGVYTCALDHAASNRFARLGVGVANWGVRPTFAAGPSLEVHVFDYAGDLYDRTLRVHLVSRLRDERSFESPEALSEQIRRDVARAREELAGLEPDPAAGEAWY